MLNISKHIYTLISINIYSAWEFGNSWAKSILVKCLRCGSTNTPSIFTFICGKCGGPLEILIDNSREITFNSNLKSMWKYREVLPIFKNTYMVSLGEGYTPLVKCSNLNRRVFGLKNIYVKNEGLNPTGSFKDRGMSLIVSLARTIGIRKYIVASTGNTAASAAAYVARAGGELDIYLPRNRVAKGKILQALMYGGRVKYIDGSFDKALGKVKDLLGSGEGYYPLNSINPWRLEGQKTISYEIVDQLGFAPDWVFVPVGNAGNIYAIGKGFIEQYEMGIIDKLPKIIGVQASGSDPMVRSWKNGGLNITPISNPRTVASAIRIGNPVNWFKAFKVLKALNGDMVSVDDDLILKFQYLLARYEGILVEPASASSLAGLYRFVEENIIDPDETVVVIATGNGLKDPSTLELIIDREQKY